VSIAVSGSTGVPYAFVFIAGLTVDANGTISADGSGNFSSTVPSAGKYLFYCELSGWTFSPYFLVVTIAAPTSGLNFSGAQAQPPTALWTKQGGVINPPGGQGALEATVIHEGNPVILSGIVFKMWYTAWPGGAATQINYAESADGISWSEYSSNPVLSTYTASKVFKTGAIYYMYACPGGGADTSVDAYTSSDGVTWSLAKTGALTPGAAGQWDDTQIYGLRPVYIDGGGTWHALYSGNQSGGVFHTGLATSSDGLTWTKYSGNPVLTNFGSPWILKIGSTFYAWGDKTRPGQNSSLPNQWPTDVHRSSSQDLIHWTYPVDSLYRTTALEGLSHANSQIDSPVILQVGNTTYFWYGAGANAATGTDFNVYLATSTHSLSDIVSANRPEAAIFAPKFVQSIQNSGTTTVTGVFGSPTTQGSLLVAICLVYGTSGAAFVSLTDTLNNTWETLASGGVVTTTGTWFILACTNNIGGPLHVTLTGTAQCTFVDLGVVEYIGGSFPNPIDGISPILATIPSVSSLPFPNVTTAYPNGTLIALSRTGGNVTVTPGAGYTARMISQSGYVENAADGSDNPPGQHTTTSTLSSASPNNFSAILGVAPSSANIVPPFGARSTRSK
jgi:hypothetical protein